MSRKHRHRPFVQPNCFRPTMGLKSSTIIIVRVSRSPRPQQKNRCIAACSMHRERDRTAQKTASFSLVFSHRKRGNYRYCYKRRHGHWTKGEYIYILLVTQNQQQQKAGTVLRATVLQVLNYKNRKEANSPLHFMSHLQYTIIVYK